MRWPHLLGIGILAFVVGLIVFLPARVVTGWLMGPDSGISLSAVHGTLLEGRAGRISLDTTVLEDVHWQWQPAALLTGHLAMVVRVASDLGGLNGTLAQSFWGTTSITAIQGHASVGWLARHTGYTFVPLTGRLRFDLDYITLNDQLMPSAADGRLYLEDTYWQLARTPLQLGNYTARINMADGRMNLQVSASEGPLAVHGQATLSPESNLYAVRARVRARTGADQQLQALLDGLGQVDQSGTHHINIQGRL